MRAASGLLSHCKENPKPSSRFKVERKFPQFENTFRSSERFDSGYRSNESQAWTLKGLRSRRLLQGDTPPARRCRDREDSRRDPGPAAPHGHSGSVLYAPPLCRRPPRQIKPEPLIDERIKGFESAFLPSTCSRSYEIQPVKLGGYRTDTSKPSTIALCTLWVSVLPVGIRHANNRDSGTATGSLAWTVGSIQVLYRNYKAGGESNANSTAANGWIFQRPCGWLESSAQVPWPLNELLVKRPRCALT
jgi:hypothetical protein